MMDYPETSGNLRKWAAVVSGRFPDFFINEKFFGNKFVLINDVRPKRLGLTPRVVYE
jgi:hypothetical protein